MTKDQKIKLAKTLANVLAVIGVLMALGGAAIAVWADEAIYLPVFLVFALVIWFTRGIQARQFYNTYLRGYDD